MQILDNVFCKKQRDPSYQHLFPKFFVFSSQYLVSVFFSSSVLIGKELEEEFPQCPTAAVLGSDFFVYYSQYPW